MPSTRRPCARRSRSRRRCRASRTDALGQSVEAVGIANLQAEIQTRRDNLEQFYQARSANEATARFQETRQSNVTVVDRALVPGGPYQPNLKKDLSGGLGLGLAGGILLVFLFHYLDRTVKTGEQAEQLMGSRSWRSSPTSPVRAAGDTATTPTERGGPPREQGPRTEDQEAPGRSSSCRTRIRGWRSRKPTGRCVPR